MKRILVLAAIAVAFLSMFALLPVQAQQGRTVISAQGSPYLVDFLSRLSKRGDLSANVTRKGLNAAFSEWLSVEHPDAYQSAVRQLVSRMAIPGEKVAMHTGKASGSCCVMASGCCSMCPACCERKSCTKGCCNLSACTTRPGCCR